MVARTLATANLKTFQRTSLWTTLPPDPLGSSLCSGHGQKAFNDTLDKEPEEAAACLSQAFGKLVLQTCIIFSEAGANVLRFVILFSV